MNETLEKVLNNRIIHQNNGTTLDLIAYTEGWGVFVKDKHYPCWGWLKVLDWHAVRKHLEADEWRLNMTDTEPVEEPTPEVPAEETPEEGEGEEGGSEEE